MPVTRKQLAIIVLAWTLFAWLNGTLLYFGILAEGATPQWSYGYFVLRGCGRWLIWAALTPPVMGLARRVPPAVRFGPLALHIAAMLVATALHAFFAVVSDILVAPTPPDSPFIELWQGLLTFYAPVDFSLLQLRRRCSRPATRRTSPS